MGTTSWRAGRGPVIAALAALSILSMMRGFLSPYVTPADNNTATFAQPARNFLRYGVLATRFGLTSNTGESQGGRLAFNTHHPPLQSLAAAGVFAVTGVSDWTARIYPALCSVLSALLLFGIWRRHRGMVPAATAALMMVALPAFRHYGKMLGEEPPTLMFGLLTMALYQRWKDAPKTGGASSWTLSYAAGCLSGWAAFHVGPLLMLDAAVTLRQQAAKRRRAMVVLALTGLTCFGLILAHVAILTGSTDVLMEAARNRTIGPEQAASTTGPRGTLVWLQQETVYLKRLYGEHSPLLLAGGLAAGVVALVRRRATLSGTIALVVLAGIGLAHPLMFPWAAYYHDWLLFHLLPMMAISGAEGLCLLCGVASGGLRLARASVRLGEVAGAGVVVAGLAGHTYLSAQQARLLQKEAPCYAWPLVGREVSRLTGRDANIMANFPMRDAPLRFYADRPCSTVRTIEAFDQLVPLRRYELYVRDLSVPIAPELERRLEEGPCLEVAAFQLCALIPGSLAATSISAEAAATPQREWRSNSLEAAFGTALRLTGYEWAAAPVRPVPRALLDSFLGVADQRFLRERVVRVRSRWTLLEAPSLPWRITTVMTVEPPLAAVSRLPDTALPSQRARLIPPPAESGSLMIDNAFLLPDDETGSWLHLRWAASENGRMVQPVLPGQPHRQIKVVVSDPIPVFGGGPGG